MQVSTNTSIVVKPQKYCVHEIKWFYINLFKVDYKASYPYLYKSLSTTYSRWSPSHFIEQALKG